jgi:hypothetical protein
MRSRGKIKLISVINGKCYKKWCLFSIGLPRDLGTPTANE